MKDRFINISESKIQNLVYKLTTLENISIPSRIRNLDLFIY